MVPKRLDWNAVRLRLGQFPHLPFRIVNFRGKQMLGKGTAIVATTPYAALACIDAYQLELRSVA